MPVRMTTPRSEIEAYILQRIERERKALIYNLKVAGEKVVNRARITAEKGRDFLDQTGNLRSSIGYVLVVDGEIVFESSFEVVKDGYEGSKQGRAFAESLAEKFPQGIALIVVAGKNYAKYVAAKGYDVLDSAELLARQLLPQILNQLGV